MSYYFKQVTITPTIIKSNIDTNNVYTYKPISQLTCNYRFTLKCTLRIH